MAIETPSAAFATPSINGTNTYVYPFNNSKFEDDDVFVYLYNSSTGNYDIQTVPTNYAISGNTITFTSIPTTQVLILRRTDFNALKIPNFTPGSSIRGADLDSNFTQLLRVSQEFRDLKVDKFFPEVKADLNMNGQRIDNLFGATVDSGAVTREQLGNVIAQDITGNTTQGIVLTKTESGSNSGDEMVISASDSSPTQKGTVIIEPATNEAVNVTYSSGTATIGVDKSTATQQGVVSINPNSNGVVNVTYTADGEVELGVNKSTTAQQGVVRLQQVAGEAANVTYTADGEVSVGIDKSTASQQGVVKIQSTAPLTTTYTADGEVELSIADGSVDIGKLKADDIITTAEQDAGSPSWVGLDDALATVGALEKRHDVLYQSSTPSGTDWQTGKLWYNHAGDQTLSVWSGSNWIGISSGGTFVTQPTVIWVDQANGDDSNDGHRIIDSMKTIKAAVASADAGDIVLVAPGVYREAAPIDITVNNLSIIGQSLRSCFVHPTPATEENILFRVNSGTQIANFSMAGMKASGTRGGHAVDSDSTYGLPTNQGWAISFYPNSIIYKSPYIQNCTTFMDSGIFNHTQAEYNANNSLGGFFDPNNVNQGGFGGDRTSASTGGGLYIDGDQVSSSSPLRSMVVDSFTQINLDGPGALVCNNAYAQFVSFFGTFCHYHCKSLNGGRVNLSNCTTDYGRYGLIADGKSTSALYSTVTSQAAIAGALYVDITKATAPSSWFGSGALATRPTDDMLMQIGSDLYALTGSDILNSSGVVDNTEANPTGYRIHVIRTAAANRSTNLGLISNVASGANVSFFFRSYISSGGHTFEYVGAGTDYDAAPENGGQPVEANRTVERNDGAVWQSSTDHNGKFTVGNFMVVDQKSGLCEINNINGLAFPTSDGSSNNVLSTDGAGTLTWQSISALGGSGINNLNEDTTPQLGGDLDVVTYDIISTGNRDIDLDPGGSGVVVVKGNNTRGSGSIKLNCEANSHGVQIKSPPHSANASYTLTLPNALPSTTGQALTSDTNGNLGFAAVSSDALTTPQTITASKTYDANSNIGLMGPAVAVASSATLTVPSTSVLTII
tara:strand:- start:113 stop:3331 length:3219 start_codon:yes stop_codon:yes gene_type:complete